MLPRFNLIYLTIGESIVEVMPPVRYVHSMKNDLPSLGTIDREMSDVYGSQLEIIRHKYGSLSAYFVAKEKSARRDRRIVLSSLADKNRFPSKM
jgi:hypothetical protein